MHFLIDIFREIIVKAYPNAFIAFAFFLKEEQHNNWILQSNIYENQTRYLHFPLRCKYNLIHEVFRRNPGYVVLNFLWNLSLIEINRNCEGTSSIASNLIFSLINIFLRRIKTEDSLRL